MTTMRFRGFVIVALTALGSMLGASCSDTPGASRFCDVVKRIEASADPMADPSVFASPAVLRAAMEIRVRAYADLARVSPDEVAADVRTTAAQIARIDNALAAGGYDSALANSTIVTALMRDDTFIAASRSVERFAVRCVDGPT